MKLLFYSGGAHEINKSLDKELIKLSGKKRPSVTFVPSHSLADGDEVYYYEYVKYYKKFKFHGFFYFPVDRPFTEQMAKRALNSDIIYLSGGNTFYFLYHLKKSGFLNMLKTYVATGGVLAGLSAGAIIMTPSIGTAMIPAFDADENIVKIKNLRSLGVSSFEFFPHYVNSKRYNDPLKSYSSKIKNPLFACPDGSGIIFKNDTLTFFGESYAFVKGDRYKLT